jgi:hypothetical protein
MRGIWEAAPRAARRPAARADRFDARPPLRCRPEAIVSRRALEAEPHQERNAANQRHEDDQQAPAGAIGVVQPPDADGDGRDDQAERDNPLKYRIADDRFVDDRGEDVGQGVEEREPPIFRPRRAALKVRVFRQAGSNRQSKAHIRLPQPAPTPRPYTCSTATTPATAFSAPASAPVTA